MTSWLYSSIYQSFERLILHHLQRYHQIASDVIDLAAHSSLIHQIIRRMLNILIISVFIIISFFASSTIMTMIWTIHHVTVMSQARDKLWIWINIFQEKYTLYADWVHTITMFSAETAAHCKQRSCELLDQTSHHLMLCQYF